jgi:peroxiredoxin
VSEQQERSAAIATSRAGVNDGTAHGDGWPSLNRLLGMPAPAVALTYSLDATVSLAQLARRHSLVVFFHHGDMPRVRTWVECEGELQNLGWMAVSVSAQTPLTQLRLATSEVIGHVLLSDPKLRLASVLELPTTQIPEERAYEPLTLLIRDERIAHTFYPIDPEYEIHDVVKWIKRTDA